MFKGKSISNCVSINGTPLTVAEFFSGIGGTRLAVEQVGFKVVCASEIDKACIQTYKDNFGDTPFGDITKIKVKELPDFTVLAASTPCQSFSNQGLRKGLRDNRGQLIHDVLRIIDGKKPKVVFIENVKGLATVRNGHDLKAIIKELKDRGYFPHYQVLKASDFGVPQNRERLFIVAFSENVPFKFPSPTRLPAACGDVLEGNAHNNFFLTQDEIEHQIKMKNRYDEKGHGFGYKVLDLKKPARTILKSSSSLLKNLVPVPFDRNAPHDRGVIELTNEDRKTKKYHLRKLTPRDCANLQGFPESYNITSSSAQSYSQFGNSVPVPVIREIFKEVLVSLALWECGVRVQGKTHKGTNPKPTKKQKKTPDNKKATKTKKSGATEARKARLKLVHIEADMAPPIFPKVKISTDESLKESIKRWTKKDKSNHFMTPNWLVKFIHFVCPLELDAASSPEANSIHKFSRILTKKDNALSKSWKVKSGQGVFVNPPYCGKSNLLDWANKIADEFSENQQPIFALVPARATETRWFRKFFESATHIVFLKERLTHNDTISVSKAQFPSALVIFGGNQLSPEKFELICQLGACVETPHFRLSKLKNKKQFSKISHLENKTKNGLAA